jgi:hypothetical protein
MKKEFALKILAFALVLTSSLSLLVGCAKSNENEEESGAAPEATEDLDTQGEYCILKYENAENGKIDGELEQKVLPGESGKAVKAIADEGYVFAGWSDGKTLSVRRDTKVEGHLTVSPKFVKEGTKFSVRYEVRSNNHVVRSVKRMGRAGENINFTLGKAPIGYTYGNWSDGEKAGNRFDAVVAEGKTFVIELQPLALSIPVIEISTEDGKGVTDRENYKSCSVSLSNTDEDACFENIDAQIRGRGNSSWNYPKKGFRLKFDKKRSMLGSDYKAKTWIFVSNYGDKSLVRNMIAYDMSELFSGLDYTVKHECVDVYVDGNYCGMYMMTDKVDVGEGKIEFDKNINSDPEKTAYILEVGDTNPGEEGVDHMRIEGDFNRRYKLNFPETDDPAYDPDVHLTYIKNYVEECLETINGDDWDRICELIDIDSFIDHYIIQEMFMNKDGFWRSIYFYKEPNGRLYAGPVWDFDQGAGNVDGFYGSGVYETTPSIDIDYSMTDYGGKEAGVPWIAGVSLWYKGLFKHEEFVELVRVRLGECGPLIMQALEKATTDGSVEDSYYTLYADAMERNFEKWDIMGKKIWPNTTKVAEIKTVKGQIDYMREWLIERYDVLCKHYGVYAGEEIKDENVH